MSVGSPIKITFPDNYSSVNFLIVGIGESGKKAIDTYLSNTNLKALNETNGIISSVTFCSECFHTQCREEITNEYEKAEFVVSLLNANDKSDLKRAYCLAEQWRLSNREVYSLCVCCGDCSQEDRAKLEQVYNQLIYVSTYDELLEPWLLFVNMNRSGCIGVDFADYMAIVENISSGYYLMRI